ncbi:hypothetical protein XFF6994_3650017 [Xanthomonas citri pv. fuscans]|nr:hypothetical protein XFF6994_3650017 [Xanthomonas citri pv. fuscans]
MQRRPGESHAGATAERPRAWVDSPMIACQHRPPAGIRRRGNPEGGAVNADAGNAAGFKA